jgi:PIN domain nuclease of toxin-antitoxin system
LNKKAIAQLLTREVYGNGFEVLAIQASHLDELTKLVFHHKDTFDRLMIAQALAERMPVIKRDGAFGRYPVSLLWGMIALSTPTRKIAHHLHAILIQAKTR